MTSEATPGVAVEPKARGAKSYRRQVSSARLTVEQSRRQNDVLRSAWRNLGGRESVIAFLNTHNDHLGGQPLELALRSDDGLLRVERLLQEITLRA